MMVTRDHYPLYPRNAIGAVAGLVGFGGAMGGVVFGQVVGTLLDRGFGSGVVFALAGSFHGWRSSSCAPSSP